MEQAIDQKLPSISFKIFSELDPEKDLDKLSCPVCFEYYQQITPKRPAICCQNKHIACQKCIKGLIQQARLDNLTLPLVQRKPARCMFCRLPFLECMKIDKESIQLCIRMQKITDKLKEVSDQVRMVIMKDCQRRIRRDYERRERQLEEREVQFFYKQHKMKETIQNCLAKNRALQNQLEQARARIQQLQTQNKRPGELNKKTEVGSISKRKIENQVYQHSTIYNQFAFYPFRNKDYWLYFQDRKTTEGKTVMYINKARLSQLKRNELKKVVIHNTFFNYKNQQDRLLYFRLRNVNSQVLRYSFGLMDQNFHFIKGTSASLDLGLTSDNQPMYEGMEGIVHFYIDLVNMKLCIEAARAKFNENLNKNLKIGKFTPYIYYTDNSTEYELCGVSKT